MTKLDDALLTIGGYGRFQMLTYAFTGFVCMRGAWHIFAIVFLATSAEYNCIVPQNTSIPIHCALESCNATCLPDRCSIRIDATNESVACPEGIEFEREKRDNWYYELDYQTSIVTEFQLVCDSSYLSELSSSIFLAGLLFGSLGGTALSDRFGRKPILISGLLLQAVFGVGLAFVSNFIVFCILRFILGVLNQSISLSTMVYMVEIFPANHRALPGVGFQLFWAGGLMILSLMAFLFKNWRYLELAMSIPCLLAAVPAIWLLPESMPWLIDQGRRKEATDILMRAAKMNGVSLAADCLEEGDTGKESSSQTAEQKNFEAEVIESDSTSKVAHQLRQFRELFTSPKMRRFSCIMFALWFINNTAYLGLTLSISDLYGDTYINFFLSGLVEMPAYLLGMFLVNKIGRRRPLIAFHLISSIANILTVVIPPEYLNECSEPNLQYLVTAIALVGKFGITGSYSILFLYATELFPTPVRNIGLGMSSFWDTVAGIIAPFINYSAATLPWFPRSLFGTFALIGGILVVFLPETHNVPLPSTVAEVEQWHAVSLRLPFRKSKLTHASKPQ